MLLLPMRHNLTDFSLEWSGKQETNICNYMYKFKNEKQAMSWNPIWLIGVASFTYGNLYMRDFAQLRIYSVERVLCGQHVYERRLFDKISLKRRSHILYLQCWQCWQSQKFFEVSRIFTHTHVLKKKYDGSVPKYPQWPHCNSSVRDIIGV